MVAPTDEKPITKLLSELKNGGQEALHELLPFVYDELRRLTNSYLRAERSNHTLQPTALVHEVYLRLVEQNEINWQNRTHYSFFWRVSAFDARNFD